VARPLKYKNGDPSVSGIVDIIDKPGLRYWYGSKGTRECERVKRTSQAMGHQVHKAIELFLKGKSFDEASEGMTNDQQVMLSYLTDWCNKTKIEVLSMEQPLHSEKYRYGGTPDAIATFDKGKTFCIVDWKTDSVPRDKAETREREAKYSWQLAGYAIAYEEMHKVKINKGKMVRASKDLKFNVIEFDTLTEAKKEFKMLRKIYRRVKGK